MHLQNAPVGRERTQRPTHTPVKAWVLGAMTKAKQASSVAYTATEKPRLCARFRETNPMKVMKYLQRSETLKTPSLGCFLLCGSWLGGYRISGTSGTVGGVSGTGYVKQNPWQFWGAEKNLCEERLRDRRPAASKTRPRN